MSVQLKIAVLESSLIIRSGIVSVLRRLTGIDVQPVEIDRNADFFPQLQTEAPDILIVNPAILAAESLTEIRTNGSVKCIALVSSLYASGQSDRYDASVSVYDTADRIKETILSLCSANGDQNEQLSAREKEIITCVVKGLTNKQIAEQLFISPHTVITHRRNIAAKLQIHSPAGLTIYAIINKLVELDEIKNTIYHADPRHDG